jgi:hypothetical protein
MIRTFDRGDDGALVSIYNEAAADLPKFKPATLDEVRRRLRGPDFDPQTRFFAVENGATLGYATYHANGRVSYPWCRKGHEALAGALFQAVLDAMKARGIRRAFAAYRRDWPVQGAFFKAHGFVQAREMVNFAMDLVEMPTPAARTSSSIDKVLPRDIPGILRLAPQVFRAGTAEALERHLLHNPSFPAESVYVLRSRSDDSPLAVGILVTQDDYADPNKLDSEMPCYRLGAFGTDGLQVKRVNGLFSFLVAPGPQAGALSLDMMAEAAARLQETELETLGAQVPSDVPHLLRFYQQYFRQQGSFPEFERSL